MTICKSTVVGSTIKKGKSKPMLIDSAASSSSPMKLIRQLGVQDYSALESTKDVVEPNISLEDDKTLDRSPEVSFEKEEAEYIDKESFAGKQCDERQTSGHEGDLRKVFLLADETGRGLRNILAAKLGKHYEVTSVLKPYASLCKIVDKHVEYCKDFTKRDYVIILAGTHDIDLTRFQSYLHYTVNVLSHTNVLFGKISFNQWFNVDKLNSLIHRTANELNSNY